MDMVHYQQQAKCWFVVISDRVEIHRGPVTEFQTRDDVSWDLVNLNDYSKEETRITKDCHNHVDMYNNVTL